MGIPGFNGWFYENNKQAYQPMAQTTVDHLYIDMNSVLHNVLRKAENYDKYHALLHKRLDAIMRLTNPRKSVMLAIDGPAPLAKLVTQRERRKKSFSTETRKKENGGGHGKKQKEKVVSSTALTPGTPFMHDVCVSCSYFICARLANRKWQHLEFELSGPTVAGEGEVKILGRLARPRHETSVAPGDTHLIVGDDADLILMALVSGTPCLYILNAALSDNTLGPKTAVLSVDRLHQVWAAQGIIGPPAAQARAAASITGNQPLVHMPQHLLSQLLGAKADLAFLAILSSGNDYLPPVRSGPKLSELWSTYIQLRQLPQYAHRSIITINSRSSDTQQLEDHPMPSSSSSSFMRELACSAALDLVMLAEVLGAAMEGKKYLAQLQQGNTHSPIAAAAATGRADGSLSREASQALPWLKGVLWVMSMYFAGDCPDYRWCYQGGAPTAQGLRALAAAATAAMQSSSSNSGAHTPPDHYKLQLSSFSISCWGSGSSSSSAAAEWQASIAAAAAQLCGDSSVSLEPLLPHVCSLALLPAGAQEHLPSAVKHLMDSSSPIYDLYATCEGCEAVQQEAYVAQRAYDAILQKIKSLEAQTLALQGAEDAQQQQQFAAMQAELAAAKAAALAVLHAAQEKRKKHEAEAHPDGVSSFDLASLEAAVAAIPAGDFKAEERALTQLSRSLLFRMDQQPGYRQRHGQQQYGQQQCATFSSSSNSRTPGRLFRPPPPPVERFGPAFSNNRGGYASTPVVLRSLIWETAFGCLVADDPDLHIYSNYMVVGTNAAAGAARDVASAEAPARSESPQHKRKHPSPQRQQRQQQGAAGARDNTAAAAALKAVLRANITPIKPASEAMAMDSSAVAALENASSAAAAAAAALEAHNISLSPGSKQQQQQRGRSGPSSSPRGPPQQQGSAAGGSSKQARTRSPSPRPRSKQQQLWQQQQQGQPSPRVPGPNSSSGSGNNQRFYGGSETSGSTATASYAPGGNDSYGYRQGGNGAFSGPPAADSVPLPSSLLGRAQHSAAAAAAGPHHQYGPYSWHAEHQQQNAGQGETTGQRYDPLHQQPYYPQQQQPYYQQQQQYKQPYQQRYQQTQATYVQQQQQHAGYYPLQQQQLQWPQPLRSVSPASLHGYNSSTGSYVVPQPVMPPATAAAARPAGPPYPGMHF